MAQSQAKDQDLRLSKDFIISSKIDSTDLKEFQSKDQEISGPPKGHQTKQYLVTDPHMATDSPNCGKIIGFFSSMNFLKLRKGTTMLKVLLESGNEEFEEALSEKQIQAQITKKVVDMVNQGKGYNKLDEPVSMVLYENFLRYQKETQQLLEITSLEVDYHEYEPVNILN
uniref:Uncharacterized protein n=1 Tax=Romanomermis culicivorax TaxID=13658 RepID=A0A915JEN8_ROMCU